MDMAMSMANMEGMRRKPNFSLDEKLFLINYIKEHKSIHEQIDPYVGDLTKSLDGWTEIATAFEKHFPGKTSRDPNDLRSCWKRIRDKARCIYAPNSSPMALYKQLTKPKWLEKKKPVPNIVSKLAWEFMVQQECTQGTITQMNQCYNMPVDMGRTENNEWSQHSDLSSSYEQQMHSAESPELLVLAPDDSSEMGETDNDVIRIKKEWLNDDDTETIEVLSDSEKLQEFSENVECHLPTSPSKSSTQDQLSLQSPTRKEVMPKIMMVESLQSETRRKLEVPEVIGIDNGVPEVIGIDNGHHPTTHVTEGTGQMTNQNQSERIPNRLTENIFRGHVETTRTDIIQNQFSTQEVKGQHEGQKSFQHGSDETTRQFSESNMYVGQKSYREKSPRSQLRQFPEDKPDSRRGSSGQESMDGNGYFPGKLSSFREEASSSQKEGSIMSHASGSHKSPGFRPNQDKSPGFRSSQTHPPGFRPIQDNPPGFRPGQSRQPGFRPSLDGRPGEAQVTASNTGATTSRNAAPDPRDASFKKRCRTKMGVNVFDRRQSKYYQGLKYRRSRNFLARRERALDNSQQTVSDHIDLNPRIHIDQTALPKEISARQEVTMSMSSRNRNSGGQMYNQAQETAWRSRNSMKELANPGLEDFEETESNTDGHDMDFQRKRSISEVYRRPHTASAAPIMEPPENRRRSTSSFGEDNAASMLKMAQEEHNIKMQIHKRKLRILVLEQWSLEQECLQAGYDLPPDYY